MDDEIDDWDYEGTDDDEEAGVEGLRDGHDLETCDCEFCTELRAAADEGSAMLEPASEENPDGDYSGFSINPDFALMMEAQNSVDEDDDGEVDWSDPDAWKEDDPNESPFRIPED